jgi:DNA-binding NtrC family response regulator
MACLLVSPREEDHRYFIRLTKSLDRRLHITETCAGARQLLATPRVGLVLCEEHLADGNWRDVLADTESLEPAPPLIVISRLADERLWSEVLSQGGYDVLARPLDERETLRVLQSAWLHRPASRAAGRGQAA